MRFLKNKIKKYLFNKNYILIDYNYPYKKRIFNLVKNLGSRLHLRGDEAYQLYSIVKSVCENKKGDLAEVGAYQGGSSKLISEAKGDNHFYVFDTFEGLPEVQEIDKSNNKWECNFEKGEFNSDFDDVKNFLSKYENVEVHKGLFPKETGKYVKNKEFIFVHLDVDIYSSTLECLKFFYPKMEKGAVLISHDYITAKGVKKAFDEFFEDKPETVMELASTQCLFVKN
jgi:O-methyltransferase